MDEVHDFLRARGAEGIEHPGGTLYAHLVRTAEALEAWGVDRDTVVAGLAHAVYGTDGFPQGLATLEERPVVAELLGPTAEAIVYTYAASDRAVTWKAIGDGEPVPYRDRFTGEERPLAGDELRTYWTITAANELDLADAFGEFTGPLLRLGAHLLPPAGVAALG